MNNRLYVTDLDGTLLNSQMSLSPFSMDTLNRLIGLGARITFSTARSFYTASLMLKNVHFKLPCITYNGVYVMNPVTEEIIRKNILNKEIFMDVVEMSSKLGLHPYVFGINTNKDEKMIYTSMENNAQIQFISERERRNDRRLEKVNRISSYDFDEVININFLYAEEVIRTLEKEVRKKYENSICVKVMKDIYNAGYFHLEISDRLANKGAMLKYVGELLNIDSADITVFGDQANDLEMFAAAGEKIAVANAEDALKLCADYIIEGNDEDGVTKYLAKVFAGQP